MLPETLPHRAAEGGTTARSGSAAVAYSPAARSGGARLGLGQELPPSVSVELTRLAEVDVDAAD